MIRRSLTRILMVVLIAFCGYNWLQVRSLQAQVAELQSRQAARDRRTETPPALPSLTALQAQIHQLQDEAAALWRKAHTQAGRISH